MSRHANPPLAIAAATDPLHARAATLAGERLREHGVRIDRTFVALMLVEWFGAVLLTLCRTPRTWSGTTAATHAHVYAAVLLGGVLSSLPIYLAARRPGLASTRQVIAVAQMLWGALLIHLTGGRIETHFIVFGSLAFLASYRDPRVLLTATAVTAADHLLRGAFWPESVYGSAWASHWRTLEHAGWVVFEDVFLLTAMARSLAELRGACRMRAELERDYERVDAEVRRQTADLSAAKTRAEAALRETQALRRTIDEHSIVTVADADGRLTDVNDAFSRASGFAPRELLGRDHAAAGYGTRPEGFWDRVWQTIAAGRSWKGEVCNRAKDGSTYWLDSLVAPFRDDDGRVVKYVQIGTDITARKEAERRICESEEFLSRVGRVAGVGGWQLDLATNALRWTDQTCRIHGVPPGHQPTVAEAVEFYAPEVRPLIARAVQDGIDHGTAWDLELPLIMATGRRIHVRAVGEAERDATGKAVRLVGAIQDVTHRRAMEDQLRNAALTDELTGLPNRALLLDRLQVAIERHRRDPGSRYAVLFLDFDRFKMVNDSLGHEVGDELLVEIARRLSDATRGTDSVSLAPTATAASDGTTASRLGGDEFVILLDGLRADEDVARVADRMLLLLAEPYRLLGHEIVSTASIGIVTSSFGHTRGEDVLRDADTAMYRAKADGKNRFVIFDATMHAAALDRLRLESDLRRAIERDELLLHYQPIVSLATRQTEGFEALVRWRRDGRLVSPADFIPIAEDTGLILPIGRWVLEEAVRQLAAWRAACPDRAGLSMAVNLSRKQLGDPQLLPHLREALARHAVPAELLKLEVTESMVMQNGPAVLEVIKAIRALGVRISMDDFGTGYSSLACLHQFPIDVLKIDRSFVTNLSGRRDTAAVIHAVLNLAHNLGMTVVAEGLETPEQVAFLQASDCDFGQGYLFAKPLPADAAEAFLEAEVSAARTTRSLSAA